MERNGKLLRVEGLKTWFGSEKDPIKAVDGVSFEVDKGVTVALVGESGCGKSVTAMSLARLIPSPPGFYAGGQILFDGEDVLKMSDRCLNDLRGREISYVFQEPGTSLNPVYRVGYQIMEAVKLHRKDVDAREEAIKLMSMVGLPDPETRIRAYPHEMSGGMQQRVMIAMALACRPRLLVADEPTTALDVTIQAQILELLSSLQKELKMAVILITHNLGLVADTAHMVYVMYAGRVVESGATENVLSKPAHPYTRGLLDAVPRLGVEDSAHEKPARMKGIPGSVPHPARLPIGCKFAPRCSKVQDVCRQQEPEIKCDAKGHYVRCYFPL
ncbi:MAG: ABC transporter ATP-binding protein [Kiritimatiellae bacterium]|nr:ABC transporter ATP-binding protein [Kiritimatiellia bacterium]MDD5519979.1 ABC transporter ATP-binding protein [Kiritimatiellia bacterium]